MIIDFQSMDITVLPNFKGGEKEFAANMYFDGTNRIFKGKLIPGSSIGMHCHEDSCEVIFVLEGQGSLTEASPDVPDMLSVSEVKAGDCLYCPKGHSHSLKNTSMDKDLLFYAAVTKQ